MKVYLSGGPMNGAIQDVSGVATSYQHYRLRGRSEENFHDAVKKLDEGSLSGKAMITIHAEDVMKTVYLPCGEGTHVPHAVVKGISYPIWEAHS